MYDVNYTSIGSEWRVARRPHVCQCGSTIKPGTRYQRIIEKVDGSVETTKVGDHVHSFEADDAAWDAKNNWF